jgi:hypothetical protein
MISIAVVMTLMGTNGPKEQESCLLVEVEAFGHQSFLGRRWKDVCAMIAILDGSYC